MPNMRVCSSNDNVIHTIMSRLLPALCSLCRYVLVKYAVRGVAQDGRLSPLFRSDLVVSKLSLRHPDTGHTRDKADTAVALQ